MGKKWLFFDIGSTLIDEEFAYKDFIKRCVHQLQEIGIEVDEQKFYDKMLQFAKEGSDPITSAWNFFAPFDLERPMWSHAFETVYPGVVDMLATLTKTYSLGIIANQGLGLQGRLEGWKIRPYFELVIASSDVGMKKPNKEIFQYALTKAGISAKQAIYIGDRIDNDIIPAKKIGMRVIRVLQGFGQYAPENMQQTSDICIASILDLPAVLHGMTN
ncbi:HAD family hydrolase [Streptococcus sp. E29BA]|uniref:HAD family hydrolase n=1 Tax=Streptococcus sp. E29BA TaxID=3278716 RepID=UPI00359DE578